MSQSQRIPAEITGRQVLALFCGFFAVVFAVNAYFVTVAVSTHTGVVANEPYRKGLKYNERIAAWDRQGRLGWNHDIAFAAGGKLLVASLRDAEGLPVRGLAIKAVLGRPATTREDANLKLAETAPGQYEAEVTLIDGGVFIASFEASDPLRSADGVVYRGRRRLWLKQ